MILKSEVYKNEVFKMISKFKSIFIQQQKKKAFNFIIYLVNTIKKNINILFIWLVTSAIIIITICYN